MLFVVGDSHAVALRDGLTVLDAPARDLLERQCGDIKVGGMVAGYRLYEPFFRRDEWGLSFLQPFADRFAAFTQSAGVICRDDERIFGFCFGFHLFGLHPALLGHHPMWQQYSLLHSDNRQFLSSAVVTEIILHQSRYVLQFAEALQELGVRAFFIGPPPVRRRYIEKRLRGLVEEEAVRLQLQVWDVMGAALNALSIPYILAPPETSINGILRPEFGTNDDHHGNAQFGGKMWRLIAARIEAGTFPILCPPRASASLQAGQS